MRFYGTDTYFATAMRDDVERSSCRHCGEEIVPCKGGLRPGCIGKGWRHAALAGSRPIAAHYCGGHAENPVAEPAPPEPGNFATGPAIPY